MPPFSHIAWAQAKGGPHGRHLFSFRAHGCRSSFFSIGPLARTARQSDKKTADARHVAHYKPAHCLCVRTAKKEANRRKRARCAKDEMFFPLKKKRKEKTRCAFVDFCHFTHFFSFFKRAVVRVCVRWGMLGAAGAATPGGRVSSRLSGVFFLVQPSHTM
nr:hypothetical protein [Pandoravirus massiliensis]